jgi:hypothetical protein
MATFYLMPPRPLMAERLADYLASFFPGIRWTGRDLVDALTEAVARHPDVFVVYREDLPDGERADCALAEGFGAEPGDEVIEVQAGGRLGPFRVRRWHMSETAQS